MFSVPAPTAFDLRWRMFGIPVRVHPTFWLFTAMMGMDFEQRLGFSFLVLWVGCMFVSILLHEMGHVLVGRICGQPGQIVLYSLGGLAVGPYQLMRPWQRIVLYLAGPGAQFLLLFLVYLFAQFLLERIDPARNIRHLHYGIIMLRFINIFWGVFNLIPIFPLDGGQVSREVCTMISPRLGSWFSLGLSFLLAGLVVIYSAIVMSRPSGELWYPSYGSYQMVPIFAILMFGFMGLQCLFMMRAEAHAQQPTENDQDPESGG